MMLSFSMGTTESRIALRTLSGRSRSSVCASREPYETPQMFMVS